MLQFFGDFKSRRAPKLHYWFKSYGDLAEWVDFAYWWSFTAGGSAINGATSSSLFKGYCFQVLYYVSLFGPWQVV